MIPLEPDKYYHIYNRANGNERIFLNNGNYEFFLKKYEEHIAPVAETFCYCLMPNHFHLLIKIKSSEEIKLAGCETSEKAGLYCSKRFSNFFSSYAQAFNKQQGRMGSLFKKNFKRKEVDSEKYLFQLVHYIHNNPLKAGLSKNLEEWPFSSYTKITSDEPTFIKKEAVLSWYDDQENFEKMHLRKCGYDLLE